MKRIAIIAPCVLPVPATKGGAVESLITKLLDDNEKAAKYEIDLFTIADTSYDSFNYRYTNVIAIESDRKTQLRDRVFDKAYRSFEKNARRELDIDIAAVFAYRLSELGIDAYETIVVENLCSVALQILAFRNSGMNSPIYFHMHNDVDIYRSCEDIRTLVAAGVRFLAVSHYIKSQIEKCDSRALVDVLYNGTDKIELCENKTASDKSHRYLYTGRVIKIKGVLELAKAFVEADVSDSKLLIVGFSDSLSAYEKKVLAFCKKHSDVIECINKVSSQELSEIYKNVDVVVMPTLNEEPFGLVALEAMAHGKPLIVTKSGGLTEVVDENCALTVDINEKLISQLASAIKDLADKNRCKAMGAAGRNRACSISEFDISTYFSRFSALIDEEKTSGKVSVIVPVYNVEPYLKRCLDSICGQTYSNMEILLINDGSTDNSKAICEEYASKDSRIKVFNKENGGLSSARNTGLDNMEGDYVYFVDSDDWIEENAIQLLVEQMGKTKSDIVACGIAQNGNIPFTSDVPAMFSGEASVIDMITTNNVCTVAWNKLYKSYLWDDIRFPIGMLHEDEATIYKLLYKSKLVSYTPTLLYNYFLRDTGIMGSDNNKNDDFIKSAEERLAYFKALDDKVIVLHCVATLLDRLKFAYRASENTRARKLLQKKYLSTISTYGVPHILGYKKAFGFWLWIFLKY